VLCRIKIATRNKVGKVLKGVCSSKIDDVIKIYKLQPFLAHINSFFAPLCAVLVTYKLTPSYPVNGGADIRTFSDFIT
jgi:hypothetical protein